MDSAFTKNNSRRANSRFGLGQYELDTQSSALDGSRVVSIAREQRGRPQGRTSSGPSTLVQRNIAVGSRRTTVRLEPAIWDALREICKREDVILNELFSLIAGRRSASSLTAAIRVFAISYFRSAATEEGHTRIGHGLHYGEDGLISRHSRNPEGT